MTAEKDKMWRFDVAFEELGFVTEKLGTAWSGFCVYPLYRFDLEKLAEYGK